MDRDQTQQLKSIIERVTVFRNLNITEARYLLKLCHPKAYRQNELIYRAGEPSTEMLILLQGKLKVVGGSGTVLGEILPGTTIGEMGVLTGCPRSATIIALEKSAGFVIEKSPLERLLLSDQDIRVKVLENIVRILCERLIGANTQIENYAEKTRDTI